MPLPVVVLLPGPAMVAVTEVVPLTGYGPTGESVQLTGAPFTLQAAFTVPVYPFCAASVTGTEVEPPGRIAEAVPAVTV